MHYTHDDGLAGHLVQDIGVAPDNALWFAVLDAGISRFDGQTWTTYTTADGLGDNDVSLVFAAPDGALWFAGRSGVTRSKP